MNIIKAIKEYDDGETASHLITITLDSDETIELVLAYDFAADRNTADYSPTGRWFCNRGRLVDTCSGMYLVRQTAILDV